MKKEDYTKYRGYILKNEYSENAKQCHNLSDWALIAQIDYDIGITIVDLFDKDNYIMCLRNPEILRLRKVIEEVTPLYQSLYNDLFNHSLRCIKYNTLYHDSIEGINPFTKKPMPSVDTCVFS